MPGKPQRGRHSRDKVPSLKRSYLWLPPTLPLQGIAPGDAPILSMYGTHLQLVGHHHLTPPMAFPAHKAKMLPEFLP